MTVNGAAHLAHRSELPPVHVGFAVADDGYPLPFRVDGEGRPILVYNGLLSSRHHWGPFIDHFRRRAAVVTWDYRGHGGTAAPPTREALSMPGFAADGHRVLLRAARAPAVLCGLSMGVQAALEHVRAHPEDVRALVLLCGTSGHPIIPWSPVRRAVAGLMRAVGGGGRRVQLVLQLLAAGKLPAELAYMTGGADRTRTPPDLLPGLFRHVAAMDPAVIGEVVAAYLLHDAWDTLPGIRAPTLIVAADRDQLTPALLSERMHRAIPGSELVVVPQSTHLAQVEYPEQVNGVIDAFLSRHGL